MTFFVSPFAQDASILMSSPAPHGMFLICNAAITEPPHLVEGWPEGSDAPNGTKPVNVPPAPGGERRQLVYPARDRWEARSSRERCRNRSLHARRPKSGTDPRPGRRGCCR